MKKSDNKKYIIIGLSVLALILLIVIGKITGFVVQENSYNIILEDNSFSPKELSITTGETIQWKNKGEETCLLLSHDRTLNSEELTPSKTISKTFNEKGDYFYFCKNNPTIEGLIIVR